MTRRRLEVFTAITLGVALAFVGFALLNGPLRDLEVLAVLALLSPLGDRSSAVHGHVFQLLPDSHNAFRAELTPYCSSLISLLALAAIALFVLHGSWPRRLLALGAAMTVVLCCNVLRVTASLLMGYQFGDRTLVLFHDWAGTLFALAYTMGGFFLMLFLLLPSASARIPRAARVSDVL
jgi:carbamoyl-phosphate synthase large subunit